MTQLLTYSNGSQAFTSGCRTLRVVRKHIRAVADLFEWFAGIYERSLHYTSGSRVYTSGSQTDTGVGGLQNGADR
ncbi:hypothetical protein [Sporosarcina cyprini]|uniref:hypothetical protein n=1 Tax=Sporosarcina cyprini TaxID=2910523 RepID=UPI001EE096BD|nr:hypothetical protein [Sporosarcina cyprini]MCG3086730.1 hypothetical protein [Sporosarcina cyprini]